MINRVIIRELAGDNIYNRGLYIYNNLGVKKIKVEADGRFHFINAVVKAGQGQEHQEHLIEMVYNQDKDILVEADCNCSAYHSDLGICKNCTAVLLEYLDYITVHGEELKKKPNRKTTIAIKQYLKKYQNSKLLPVIQNEFYGKIRLEPYVAYISTGLLVQFKIGVSKMYVLKDLLEFARLVERGENHVYGKNLEFNHSMEMFDPDSRELVRFIIDWGKQNFDRYTLLYQNVREILIKGSMVEDFLNATGGRDINIRFQDSQIRQWQVVKEPFKRAVKIRGKGEGIEISVDHCCSMKGKNEQIYFFDSKIYRSVQDESQPMIDFLSAVEELTNRTAYIEKEDIPVFCREVLPELEKYCVCNKVKFNADNYGITPATFEIYLDLPQENFVTIRVLAVYGEHKYSIFGDKKDLAKRELDKEARVNKLVSSYCNAYNNEKKEMVLADDEELLYELLTTGIGNMQQVGEVFISDALKKVTITQAPRVFLGITLSGNLMELSMTAGDMSKEQLIEILSKYDRKKKYFRLKNGDFIDLQDEGMQALLEIKEGLRLTDKQLAQGQMTVPRYRALYLDGQLKDYQALPVIKDKGFKSLIRNMKTVDDNDFEIPHAMDKILREYQKRGFLWLKTLKNNGFGGILADDMGLGKTLQVISLLESERLEGAEGNLRSLIVTPASLVYNWNSEIEKFAPGLPVIMITGKTEERKNLIETAGEHDILLTSYDLLKRDIDIYAGISFANQIIDEAQFIKNHNTQAAKAVKEIDAGFKLALTGTPVENRLGELWSIFDYLMPGFLYSYQKFRQEIETPIIQSQDQKALERLQKMIRPFVLRRVKKDVLTDLPDKLEKNYFARLEGEQQQLYDAHVKRLKLMLDKQSDEEFRQARIQILSELTRLRQICCNPGLIYEDYQAESVKMQLCLELIQNAVAGGYKILLFSQFTTMLELLKELMEGAGISTYILTGATSKAKRAELVENFNQDNTQVFCISLKAGGTGLNLTAADIVIHYDPWWNQAAQTQATDRAHRIGQKNVVTVYKLIIKGTIEENIVKMQEQKSALADQVLGGESLSGSSFSKEELLKLL